MVPYYVDQRNLMFWPKVFGFDDSLRTWPFLSEELVGKEDTADLESQDGKMKSTISPELIQDFLQQTVEFAADEIAPLYLKYNAGVGLGPGERGTYFENGNVFVPPPYRRVLKLFNDLGLGRIDISPENGGLGLPHYVESLMALAYVGADPPFALLPGLTFSGARVLEKYGSPWLKKVFLPKLVKQEWLAAMTMTEEKVGSNLPDMETIATWKEGDVFLIKGQKVFISGGDHDVTGNIIHFLLAQTQMPDGTWEISLFAVPKFLVDEEGNIMGPNGCTTLGIEKKLGLDESATCSIGFGNGGGECIGYLIGELGKGLKQLLISMMNESRLFVGIQACSTMARAYRLALVHARERDIYEGKLIDLEDVRRRLTMSKCQIDGWTALLLLASFAKDMAKLADFNGDRVQKMQWEGLLALLTPLCKMGASDAAKKVIDSCKTVKGGWGYILVEGIASLLRDCHVFDLYEGANPVMVDHVLKRVLPSANGAIWAGLQAMVVAECEEWQEADTLRTEAQSLANFFQGFGKIVAEFVSIFVDAKKKKEERTVQPHILAHYKSQSYAFVEAMNRLLLSYVLLKGAVAANKALDEKHRFHQANNSTIEAYDAAVENDPECAFYLDKVVQVRYFFQWELPKVTAFCTSYSRVGNGYSGMSF